MDYEYVALTWKTERAEKDPVFRDNLHELLDERWEEFCRAPFDSMLDELGGVCIMRRPKDEPRMWTEGEIQEICKETLSRFVNWRDV